MITSVNGMAQDKSNSNETIDIWSTSGDYQDLSNFAIRPFVHDGIKFQSVEQAFQFEKSKYSPKTPQNDSVGKSIRGTAIGSRLRGLGKKFVGLDTKTWDNNTSAIMEQLMTESFEQNPNALQRLLSTGSAKLTHNNEREGSKWRTEFPRILMKVRDKLGRAQ